MRDARQPIELDVVLLRDLAQHALRALAQLVGIGKFLLERLDGLLGEGHQLLHPVRAVLGGRLGVLGTVGGAALLDLAQAVVQRADQHLAALGVFEQVVLEVRIAAHDPDVAEHFVQHPCGAASAALATQFIQNAPGFLAQQADNDLAVREGRVVIGDLTQARGGVLCGELGIEHEWGVHGGTASCCARGQCAIVVH
ncbi:hypothetical protein D3C85_1106090 [compost metagenome]